MRGNILKRIENLERKTDIRNTIPENDRMNVLSYPDGDEAECDRLLQERITELKSRYGANITADDFLVVWLRKFYGDETGGVHD